jgi:hypothetical protein
MVKQPKKRRDNFAPWQRATGNLCSVREEMRWKRTVCQQGQQVTRRLVR